jgi:radical SAM protein with 4Fe4S-binding SPASM domain
VIALNKVFAKKVSRVLSRKTDALIGRVYSLDKTLDAMTLRPYELHFELTNLCNANCIFCPYQFQTRDIQFMADAVFEKAVGDFVSIGGGSVGLTPIVGDPLIDPKFVERVRFLRSFPSIDRIWVTTNAILLDKHGVDEVLDSGLTSITISTAGFDAAMYERVYRSKSYERMRSNVLELVERNARRSEPLNVTIGLRSDRRVDHVLKDPDFQPILAHRPPLDFTWSFTSAGGRITREMLPDTMKLRVVSSRKATCVQLYNGPIVLPDGTVMACSCVAAMDATDDLAIGNVMESSLLEMWVSERMKQIRASFGSKKLNKTCAGCDMYRNPELYRTSEGRERARVNLARYEGKVVKRAKRASGAFSGG